MTLIRPIADVPSGKRDPLNKPLHKFVEEMDRKLRAGISGTQERVATGIDKGLRGLGRKTSNALFPVKKQELVSPIPRPRELLSPLARSAKAAFSLTPTSSPTMTMAPTRVPTATPTPARMPTPTPTSVPIEEMIGPPVPGVTPFVRKPSPRYQGVLGDVSITFRNPNIQNGIIVRGKGKPGYQESLDAIRGAAKEFNVSEDLLMDVAFSESSLDSSKRAVDHGYDGKTRNSKGELLPYSSAAGLFQFVDNTWPETMIGIGMSELTDKRDPVANARGAAWQISNGRLSKWDASKWMIDEEAGTDVGWGRYYTGGELTPFDYRMQQ